MTRTKPFENRSHKELECLQNQAKPGETQF